MTKTNVIPAAGYLVIEPKKKNATTESGIYLSENRQDKPQEGTVLAIGSAYVTDFGIKKDTDIKKGDVVIYREWGGKEYKENGVDLLLMKFDDVMATIKN